MRTRWLNSLNIVKPSWICLTFSPDSLPAQADQDLRDLGLFQATDAAHCYLTHSQENWSAPWRAIAECLTRHKLTTSAQACIVPGEDTPAFSDIELHNRPAEEITEISDQMWLIDVIEEQRLTCHFQSVIDRRGEVFGYESLVRASRPDGSIISGGEIFHASRLLRIEHLIDRHLHELAIKCFSEEKLSGFLFINLVPGFIQRPEFYFGGLGEAARHYDMQAKNIVLDCTNSENPSDIEHLKSITSYCRSQGYLVSLDDIESSHTAARILRELRPDFIKIDMRLVQKSEQPEAMQTIHQLVDLTRNSSCTLIAEGVETEAAHQRMLQADIGLFQGYLFTPPAGGNRASSPMGNADTRRNRA